MPIKIALVSTALLLILIGCTQAPGTGFNYPEAPPIDYGPAFDPNANPIQNPPNPNLSGIPSCDTIASAQDREACYVRYAIEHLDATVCQNLWEQINDCYSAVAYVKKDATLCEKVKNSVDAKDMCYLGVSSQTKEATLCDRIQSQSIKRQCESDTSLIQPGGLPTPEDCLTATDTLTRDLCYVGMAGELADITICEQISNPATKENCRAAVAYTKQDETLCATVQNATTQAMCYQQVAIAKNDPTVCDKIQNNPDMVTVCKMSFPTN